MIVSFDIILRDRPFLAQLPWKFVVIDEGHRLKNLHSRYVALLTSLLRELKQFKTGSRLILTGTPLHVRGCRLPEQPRRAVVAVELCASRHL